MTGKGPQVIEKVVKELADYTHFHFSAEEQLLERAQYPDLAAHRAQHRVFVNKVKQFQQDLHTTTAGQASAVVTFLKDWLTNHILQTDKQYSAHLNAKGIS